MLRLKSLHHVGFRVSDLAAGEQMRIRLSVNERLMQNSLANDMIFGVERLVSYASGRQHNRCVDEEPFGPVQN
jgi:hypothetical protein